MTLRFAAAVLFIVTAFAGLLYLAQMQREFDRTYTSRLEPLPVPRHVSDLQARRG